MFRVPEETQAQFGLSQVFGQTDNRQFQLENKLNNYFQNRRTSKAQGPSHNRDPQPRSLNSQRQSQNLDFRVLFTRTNQTKTSKAEGSNDHEDSEELLNRNSIPKRKAQSEYTLNDKHAGESLNKKKLSLMQFKLRQLQQDVQLSLQAKLDVYRQNQDMERDLKVLESSIRSCSFPVKLDTEEPDREVVQLERKLRVQRQGNDRRRLELEQLRARQPPRGNHSDRENWGSENSRQIAGLKHELQQQKANYRKLKDKFQKNQELQLLSVELRKLRRMVQNQGGKYK